MCLRFGWLWKWMGGTFAGLPRQFAEEGEGVGVPDAFVDVDAFAHRHGDGVARKLGVEHLLGHRFDEHDVSRRGVVDAELVPSDRDEHGCFFLVFCERHLN